MTVKELIEKLKKLPPNKKVFTLADDDAYIREVTSVIIDDYEVVCID